MFLVFLNAVELRQYVFCLSKFSRVKHYVFGLSKCSYELRQYVCVFSKCNRVKTICFCSFLMQ